MPNPRLSALRTEFESVRAGIDTLEQAAVTRGGDLTAEEAAQADTLHTRAEQIRVELEPLAARERSLAATADVLASLNLTDPHARHRAAQAVTAPTPGTELTTFDAGRYLTEYMRATSPDVNRGQELEGFVDRWRTTLGDADGGKWRVVADQLTTDNAAILPVPLVGQILNFSDNTRPCFDSFTSVPMPASGKTFTRPRITQHVLVDEQATEKTQLASRKMTLASETVTKRTFGGVLDISQQDIDWTDPGIMGLVLRDFADEYAKITEGEACDALEALASATSDIELGVTGTGTATTATILAGLVAGAVAIYGTSKTFPNTLWMGLDRWALLAAMVNSQDEPIFPNLGAAGIDLSQANGMGGQPVGLRPVLAPQLAAGTLILGRRELVESYEQRKGLIQAPNVALFGVDVAYAGYVAFYGRAEGFVSLVDAT